MQALPQFSRCLKPTEDPWADKPRLIRSDLNEKLETFFLEMVLSASKAYETDYDLACAIKQCLDKKFGPQWHVIVGELFGSHFEHHERSFAYIQYMGKSFLMFRFG